MGTEDVTLEKISGGDYRIVLIAQDGKAVPLNFIAEAGVRFAEAGYSRGRTDLAAVEFHRRSENRLPSNQPAEGAIRTDTAEVLAARFGIDFESIRKHGFFAFDMQKTLVARKEVVTAGMKDILIWLLAEGVPIVVISANSREEVWQQLMEPILATLRELDRLDLAENMIVYANSGTSKYWVNAKDQLQIETEYSRQFRIGSEVENALRAGLKELAGERFFLEPGEEAPFRDIYEKDRSKDGFEGDFQFPWLDSAGAQKYEPSVVVRLREEETVQAPYIVRRGLIFGDGINTGTALAVRQFFSTQREKILPALEKILKKRLGLAAKQIVLSSGGTSTIDVFNVKANKAFAFRDAVEHFRKKGRAMDLRYATYHGDEVWRKPAGINPASRGNDAVMLDGEFGSDTAYGTFKVVAVNPKPPEGLLPAEEKRVTYVGGEQAGTEFYLGRLKEIVTASRASKVHFNQEEYTAWFRVATLIGELKDQAGKVELHGRDLFEVRNNLKVLVEHIRHYSVIQDPFDLFKIMQAKLDSLKKKGKISREQRELAVIFDALFDPQAFLRRYSSDNPFKITVFRGGRGASKFTELLKQIPNVQVSVILGAVDDGRGWYVAARDFRAPGIPDAGKALLDLANDADLKTFLALRFRGDNSENLQKDLQSLLRKWKKPNRTEPSFAYPATQEIYEKSLKLDPEKRKAIARYLEVFLRGWQRDFHHSRFSLDYIPLRSLAILGAAWFFKKKKNVGYWQMAVDEIGKLLDLKPGDAVVFPTIQQQHLVALTADGTIYFAETGINEYRNKKAPFVGLWLFDRPIGPSDLAPYLTPWIKIKPLSFGFDEMGIYSDGLKAEILETTRRVSPEYVRNVADALSRLSTSGTRSGKKLFASPAVLKAIQEAHLIVYANTTFESNIGSSLIVPGVGKAIHDARAARVLFVNPTDEAEPAGTTAAKVIERLLLYAAGSKFAVNPQSSRAVRVTDLVEYALGIQDGHDKLDPKKTYIPFDQEEIHRTFEGVSTVGLNLELQQPTNRPGQDYRLVGSEWGFYDPKLLVNTLFPVAAIKQSGYRLNPFGKLEVIPSRGNASPRRSELREILELALVAGTGILGLGLFVGFLAGLQKLSKSFPEKREPTEEEKAAAKRQAAQRHVFLSWINRYPGLQYQIMQVNDDRWIQVGFEAETVDEARNPKMYTKALQDLDGGETHFQIFGMHSVMRLGDTKYFRGFKNEELFDALNHDGLREGKSQAQRFPSRSEARDKKAHRAMTNKPHVQAVVRHAGLEVDGLGEYFHLFDLFRKASDHESGLIARVERILKDHFSHLQLKQGGDFLDVGASDGVITKALMPYFKHGMAVEIDENASQRLKSKEIPGLDVVTVPIQEYTPNHKFDVILVSHSLYYIEEKDRMDQIKRMASWLKPGGKLILLYTVHGDSQQDLSKMKKALGVPSKPIDGRAIKDSLISEGSEASLEILESAVIADLDGMIKIAPLVLKKSSLQAATMRSQIQEYIERNLWDETQRKYRLNIPQELLIISNGSGNHDRKALDRAQSDQVLMGGKEHVALYSFGSREAIMSDPNVPLTYSAYKYGSQEQSDYFLRMLQAEILKKFGDQIKNNPGQWALATTGYSLSKPSIVPLARKLSAELGIDYVSVRAVRKNRISGKPLIYAELKTQEARDAVQEMYEYILESDQSYEGKNVIFVDDFFASGSALRKINTILINKYQMRIAGNFVIISIASIETKDPAIEEEINSFLIRSRPLEETAKLLNRKDTTVTRYIVASLFQMEMSKFRALVALLNDFYLSKLFIAAIQNYRDAVDVEKMKILNDRIRASSLNREALISHLKQQSGGLVLLGGPSAAGKTTLADSLKEALGSPILPVDFYPSDQGATKYGIKSHELFISHNNDLVWAHISQLLQGKEVGVTAPYYYAHQFTRRINPPFNAPLIIDGLHAVSPDFIEGLPKSVPITKVFVDAPKPIRFMRRLLTSSGDTDYAATLLMWRNVIEAEEEAIDLSRNNADFILVEPEDPAEMQRLIKDTAPIRAFLRDHLADLDERHDSRIVLKGVLDDVEAFIEERGMGIDYILNKSLEGDADSIRSKRTGLKIGVVGGSKPSKEYLVADGERLGRALADYLRSLHGVAFTGGDSGVGADFYRGYYSVETSKDKFFALLPIGSRPNEEYEKISPNNLSIERLGTRFSVRDMGTALVGDVFVAMNGGSGTMTEVTEVLKRGKPVVALNYGGAGTLLYQAKISGKIPQVLQDNGINADALKFIILGDIDKISQALDQARELVPDHALIIDKGDRSELTSEEAKLISTNVTALPNPSSSLLSNIENLFNQTVADMERDAKPEDQRFIRETNNRIQKALQTLKLRAEKGSFILGNLEDLLRGQKSSMEELRKAPPVIVELPGTFDPPHLNHVEVMLEALAGVSNATEPRTYYGVFSPIGDRFSGDGDFGVPWKPNKSPFEDRFQMTKLISEIFSPLLSAVDTSRDSTTNKGVIDILTLVLPPDLKLLTNFYTITGADNLEHLEAHIAKDLSAAPPGIRMNFALLNDFRHSDVVARLSSTYPDNVVVVNDHSKTVRSTEIRTKKRIGVLTISIQKHIQKKSLYGIVAQEMKHTENKRSLGDDSINVSDSTAGFKSRSENRQTALELEEEFKKRFPQDHEMMLAVFGETLLQNEAIKKFFDKLILNEKHPLLEKRAQYFATLLRMEGEGFSSDEYPMTYQVRLGKKKETHVIEYPELPQDFLDWAVRMHLPREEFAMAYGFYVELMESEKARQGPQTVFKIRAGNKLGEDLFKRVRDARKKQPGSPFAFYKGDLASANELRWLKALRFPDEVRHLLVSAGVQPESLRIGVHDAKSLGRDGVYDLYLFTNDRKFLSGISKAVDQNLTSESLLGYAQIKILGGVPTVTAFKSRFYLPYSTDRDLWNYIQASMKAFILMMEVHAHEILNAKKPISHMRFVTPGYFLTGLKTDESTLLHYYLTIPRSAGYSVQTLAAPITGVYQPINFIFEKELLQKAARSEARFNVSEQTRMKTAEAAGHVFSVDFVGAMTRSEFRALMDAYFPELAVRRNAADRAKALQSVGLAGKVDEGLLVGGDLAAKDGFWNAVPKLFPGQKIVIFSDQFSGKIPDGLVSQVKVFSDIHLAKSWLKTEKLTALMSAEDALEHALLRKQVSDWVVLTDKRLAGLFDAIGLEAFAVRLRAAFEVLRAA